MEFIGICAVFFAGLFAVLGRDRDWGISSKDIGLSISYALNVTQILNMMVRVASELEANIVSVERIKEYTEVPLEVCLSEKMEGINQSMEQFDAAWNSFEFLNSFFLFFAFISSRKFSL